MPSLAEIWRALHGAWRLAFLDMRGLAGFDGTRSGGLRSFWAMALVLPLNAAILAVKGLILGGETAEPGSALVEIVGPLATWVILIAVIYALVLWHGRVDRFWLFVSTYNWIQVPLAVAILVSAALFAGASGLVDPTADPANVPMLGWSLAHVAIGIAITLELGVLAYEWYVAWVALDSGIPLPIIVVLLDFVMAVGLSHLSTALA
ncbi:MAG TPA: hypothetical protein VJN67_14300 [Stellaceae bacterium]|nr:hypothetical protein [Stellaceae bacterium]